MALVFKQAAVIGIILMIMGIGILMLLFSKDTKSGRVLLIGVGLSFFLMGLAIFAGSLPVMQDYFPWQKNTAAAIFVIGMGLLFLWVGIYFIIMQTAFCREKVRGRYLGYERQEMQRGGHIYQLMFLYEFQGEAYQGLGLDLRFSKKKIEKQYLIGTSYDIFVNPGSPGLFCVKRGVKGVHLLWLLLGILCIASSFLL
ncbi:MAG: DUF3592 domain-containing protein [Bacteroides sp.]|nr:DUF3592 domain-containing protein [Bacteroides sp.]MCM1550120.1 DUF3592 domain-containing protein [Clostridium sp.]